MQRDILLDEESHEDVERDFRERLASFEMVRPPMDPSSSEAFKVCWASHYEHMISCSLPATFEHLLPPARPNRTPASASSSRSVQRVHQVTEGPEDSTPTPSHRPGKEPASSNKGKRKLEEMSSSRRVTRSAAAAAVRAATKTTLPPVVFREPIAIPADSDSSSESEDNAVADPMEFASPPTLALPPPAEVTPTRAPLPEEQIAGESAGPASGSPSDSPPLREQLAELPLGWKAGYGSTPFALQYQEDPNHSCHFAFGLFLACV